MVIGNGKTTKVWEDRWIGSTPALMSTATKIIPLQYMQLVTLNLCVSDIMTIPGREWNRDLVEAIFPAYILEKILAINPQGSLGEDSYAWDYTQTCHYTVKSGYWVQRNYISRDQASKKVDQPSLDELNRQIWKMKTSPKVRHFLWKCISETLPAAANMHRRHIAKMVAVEGFLWTVKHILFTCPYARLIWAVSPIQAPPNGVMSDSLYANIYRVKNQKHHTPDLKAYDDLVPWLLWRIWKNRNEYIFKGTDYSALSTVAKAMEDMEEWIGRKEEDHIAVKTPHHSNPRVKWKAPPPQ